MVGVSGGRLIVGLCLSHRACPGMLSLVCVESWSSMCPNVADGVLGGGAGLVVVVVCLWCVPVVGGEG